MKTNLPFHFCLLSFLFLSLSIFGQKDKIPIVLGVDFISEINENNSSIINIGSSLGLSTNLLLSRNFTLSSNLAFGKKRYDIIINRITGTGSSADTRKIYKENSISFEGNLKWNWFAKRIETAISKTFFQGRIKPFYGIGFIVKSPLKINGIEQTTMSSFPTALDWKDFQIGYEDLSFNFGTKITTGIDFVAAENYFLSFEFGGVSFRNEGFKDLRDPKRENVKGAVKNESYSYIKFVVGYLFH